jgi:hypothetical protein
VTLVLGGALLCAMVVPGAGEASSRHRCASFQGKRVLRSRMLDLVERADEARGSLYACVPPDGRVRVAGSAYDEMVDSQYSIVVVAVAGTWVALHLTDGIDACYGEETEKVFDARTGRSYRFYESGFSQDQEICGEGNPNSYTIDRVLLNRFGQLVLSLSDGTTRRIVGIGSSGARRVLDSGAEAQIPPAALQLNGHSVEWVDAGSLRSASL